MKGYALFLALLLMSRFVLPVNAGYVTNGLKKGAKATKNGVKKGAAATTGGVKKGANVTVGGTKKGLKETKKFFKKVF